MTCCQVFGVVLIFVISVSTVGLLIASGVSYDWFISNNDTPSQVRDGLWRQCKTTNNIEKCFTHENILKFSELRRDQDILILLHIVTVAVTVLGIFVTLCGLCKRERSKCIEICASTCFIIAGIIAVFMVVYTEVEMIKNSSFTRGWGIYCLYGAMGTLILLSLDAMVYSLCCREKYLEGFDKSDSLVLRTKSNYEQRYLPSESYSGYDNGSYSSHRNTYTYPARDY